AHKMWRHEEYYWTLSGKPRRMTIYDEDVAKVMFTDGTNVFADYTYVGWDSEEKAIVFTNYQKVNYPQPKQAPTRGFTYVE
ncbi:unnamed protein product, partial [marine sediment metagenome]